MTERFELANLMGKNVEVDEIATVLNSILPNGHSIHGYSSASNTRMLMILESKKYTDSAPLLGFGMDGNAERALVRALATYVKREQQGLDYITETQFPESSEGQIATGSHPSRFDNIVWCGDFWMHQEDLDIFAGSSYGAGPNMGPLEVKSSTPLGAVVKLADEYVFGRNVRARMLDLPPISLQ